MKTPFTPSHKAFTLAEVLITLAIIGVVAAITIPSVIANGQKQEFVTGLQKNYNTFNNALSLSQAENGSFDSWPWASATGANEIKTFWETYLTPYLKIIKNCDTTTNQDCWSAKSAKYLSGSGVHGDSNTAADRYKFLMADGSSWAIGTNPTCITTPNYCAYLAIDVNGNKGPNTMGRDVFRIFIYPFTNQVVMEGVLATPYDVATNSWTAFPESALATNCDPKGASSGGLTCGILIQRAGWKMEY